MSDEKFIIQPAARKAVIPLIGLFGKSGSGKTLTALLLMLGIVGRKNAKRIVVVDTENKRASHFAGDPIFPESYDTIDLQPPFAPDRVLEAYEAAAAVASGVIIDSASHEWNGEGGCLHMLEHILDEKAGNDWKQRDKYKMYAWARVSPRHEALVAALMRSKVPVILCFRAKDKVVMEKEESNQQGQGGKTKITTDEDAPIQRKDLIHEMTMAFALQEQELGGGYFTVRKRGVPTLYEAVVNVKIDRLGEAHGKAIAKWCEPPAAGRPQTSVPNELKDTFRKLWEVARPVHGCKEGETDKDVQAKAKQKLQQYLWDEGILTDTQFLGEMPVSELQQTIEKLKIKLAQ